MHAVCAGVSPSSSSTAATRLLPEAGVMCEHSREEGTGSVYASCRMMGQGLLLPCEQAAPCCGPWFQPVPERVCWAEPTPAAARGAGWLQGGLCLPVLPERHLGPSLLGKRAGKKHGKEIYFLPNRAQPVIRTVKSRWHHVQRKSVGKLHCKKEKGSRRTFRHPCQR